MVALAAAQAGLRVRIVAKGLGAQHWAAGTIDLLGYVNGASTAVEAPFLAMEALPAEHPYRLVGTTRVAATLRDLQTLLEREGLPYGGAPGFARNTLLPSPVGALRPVFLAPAAQLAGDAQSGQPMLLVGVTGLRDVYPHLMAENLNRQGISARAAFVPWEAVSELRDRNPVQLAEGLEQPEQARRLADALRPLVQRGERIGFPAILGLEAHSRVRADLEADLGVTLFEFPTLPPNVPGIRLYQTLRRLLLRLGVRTETNMEVIGFFAEDGTVQWVETATSARPLRHRARAFVLATGGVLGGGFAGNHTGEIRETVFELPLTVESSRGAWFRPQFFDPQGQPVFHGGVRTDGELRALRADGSPAFANVWAAGSALAGADSILERSMEGLAIATGRAAGEAVAAALGTLHPLPSQGAAS